MRTVPVVAAGVVLLSLLGGCGGVPGSAERRPTLEVSGCGPGGSLGFGSRPDGPVPSTDDVGRPVLTGSLHMSATVVDGALVPVADGSGSGAFYLYTDLGEGEDGWGVHATWVWPEPDDGATSLGAMGLLLFSHPLDGADPLGLESRLHLGIGANGTWQLAVVADSSYDVVAQGDYGAPALDGATVYEASALIDPDTGDVHLVLPDHSSVHVDAAEVAAASDGADVRDLGGRYAVVEAFQNARTDVVPEIRSTEAYADPASPLWGACLARVGG